MNNHQKKVGMGQYSIGSSPETLKTTALGSCIGIAIYDSFNKIGGLIHIMLPKKNNNNSKVTKYADTGILFLINNMEKKGAQKNYMKATIAGGARMFDISTQNKKMQIGKRNIEAVKNILNNQQIEITGEDVGANYGRTMIFNLKNGEIVITSHQKKDKNFNLVNSRFNHHY